MCGSLVNKRGGGVISFFLPIASHSQPQHTQHIENTWWGVKQSMPRRRTSKDLFESYLQQWLWRQHYGADLFGNIIKHIADLYEVRKDA